MTRPLFPCARRAGLLGLFLMVLGEPALAQNTVIVSLTWNGVTAGPRAQDYPPPQDDHDIWVLEDFQTTSPWFVHNLSCVGADVGGPITGVIAYILDGLPPAGNIIMQSTPGGSYIDAPPPGWGHFQTTFGGQRLEPGSYWVMWAAQAPASVTPVMFVRDGAYTVGMGTPNNAYQYNPGLFWGFPHGALEPVTAGFNHTGPPIGVNFTIQGQPAPPPCRADFNHDGAVNSQDFFEYLAAFFAGDPPADFNGDGNINSQDFFSFLAVFFAGC